MASVQGEPSTGPDPPAPARPQSSPPPAASTPTMLLHILSPSSEVSNLSFPSIAASTTVGELKTLIRDAVPTKPGPDRQRLIHRGRMLGSDADTLLEVFGQAALNNPIAHSLHLVLRPAEGPPNPPVVSAPPTNATRLPRNTVQPPPTAAPLTGQTPLAGGGSQRVDLPAHATPAMTPVFGQGTLPAQVQDILQAQIAAFDHQIQQHNHHFQNLTSATPPAPGTPGLPGARVPSPAAMHAQAFQQFVNQGQRARAAAGMHGVANNPGQGNGMGAPAGGERPSVQGSQPAHPAPVGIPGAPGTTSSFTREVQIPNGQRWQVNVNQTTTTMPARPLPSGLPEPPVPRQAAFESLPNHFPQMPSAVPHWPGAEQIPSPLEAASSAARQAGVIPGHPGAPILTGPHDHAIPQQRLALLAEQQRQFNDQWLMLSELLGQLQSAMRWGRRVSQASVARLRQGMQTLEALASLAQDPAVQAGRRETIRNIRASGFDSVVNSAAPAPPFALATQAPAPGTTATSAGTTALTNVATRDYLASTVFMLSSPSGPYALLLSPSGTYTAARRGVRPLGASTGAMRPAADEAAVNRPGHTGHQRVAQGQAAAGPAFLQQPQQQQPRPNDLLRALLPLGGHLWLLVRLLGFVFFFTGGSGWRRTAMILLGALLVFLAQTPLFAGAFQGVWGPIRRHLDNLLPPANPAVPPAAAGAGAAARQGAGQAPTPAVTAARLMRQRQRELEERGWFRERALQIERALVLLFASLVPGVGERHVAARDAEAAAAAAAAAAAEEERRRGEAARSTEAAGTVESSENGEGSAAAEGQGRAQEAAL